MIDHIKSFHPAVSHYRRDYAPNYLSPELSITTLYNDFKENHKETELSYTCYRKEVKKLNISFVKLGEEEFRRMRSLSLVESSYRIFPSFKKTI